MFVPFYPDLPDSRDKETARQISLISSRCSIPTCVTLSLMHWVNIPEQGCVPGPGYYCFLTTALSFTLLCSTSPTFSDMSQELGTTSTSLNLENQLADAMMVIQMLMVNIENLTQQVVHLTQNMALMQANQNLPLTSSPLLYPANGAEEPIYKARRLTTAPPYNNHR